MKKAILLFVTCSMLLAGSAFAEGKDKRKIIKPKECRTAKYTCVLKVVDGVPFFCQRPVRQRYRNANKKVRVVKERKCRKRFPVLYEEEKPKPN